MTLLDVTPTALQALWLILVAVLWIGYLVLEGFDYGVAMLLPFVGKNDKERRVLVNTIGPVWDGNQVWLLTAGGAMFAAFSGWYATLFSALYLPLFLILLGLIIRGVAFEYRGKRPDWTWRNRWDWAAAVGSLLPPLVFGVGFANYFVWKGREGIAFILTGGSIAMCAVMIFAHLYPGLGFDNTGLKVVLDITTASSSPTTLTLMTVAAAILVPIVLLYQIWTYTVFRRRLGGENIPDDADEPVVVGG